MKKIAVLLTIMFFVHFVILGVFFVRLDSYKPFNTSGNPMATAIAFIFTLLCCLIIFIILVLEKHMVKRFKKAVLLILLIHCFLHFCWEAFFEFDLFGDSKSFDDSAIVTILFYFIFESFSTYYVIYRLYRTKES